MKPFRIQLSRKKGWRMPPNTVKVCRPGKWGNPFQIGGWYKLGLAPDRDEFNALSFLEQQKRYREFFTLIENREQAVDFYKRWLQIKPISPEQLSELRGKNLACWCPMDQPCHADVLLEIANK